jgi:hypothetical protein
MINFPDNPPQDVRQGLASLRKALDAVIPPKTLDRNVLIGTWNIRGFGDVTRQWTTGPGDSPKRGLRHVLYIAEIISPRLVHWRRGHASTHATSEVLGTRRELRFPAHPSELALERRAQLAHLGPLPVMGQLLRARRGWLTVSSGPTMGPPRLRLRTTGGG